MSHNGMASIKFMQCVLLTTEPGISLIILPLMRILLLLVSTIRRTTDTFLFISHTTNVLLFKYRCNIFMPGSVASEAPYSTEVRKTLRCSANANYTILCMIMVENGNEIPLI